LPFTVLVLDPEHVELYDASSLLAAVRIQTWFTPAESELL
jgi:hypothetical protein